MARIHMITFVPTSATACEAGGIRIRNGGEGMNCSQNSTPGQEEAGVHQPDVHRLVALGQVEQHRDVPEHHHRAERTTATQGRSSQPATARSGRDQPPRMTPAVALRPACPGSASSSGCHGRPGHDQRRRREHQQQVLDHVHEEVVVCPVVDRRLHREQQHGQPAVEPERPAPALPGPLRPGPPGQPGQADLVPDRPATIATIRNGSKDQCWVR